MHEGDALAKSPKPELVVGLVGPIGVDMEMVAAQIEHALQSVGYVPRLIKVTDLMTEIATDVEIYDGPDPLFRYRSRIEYANAVRAKCDDAAALAALAILEIQAMRRSANQEAGRVPDDKTRLEELPLAGNAYVIRQLKRPEEIDLLRKVYGRKFLQVSVHLDTHLRQKVLANKFAAKNPKLSSQQAAEFAAKLIEQDFNEQDVPNGQRIEEVFHLGDVFVSAKTEDIASSTIKRFFDAFFGRNSISPTYDEYGSYIAASASLRSIDTARQVGAAIFSDQGEVITLGSNEVPAPGGGTYWSNDPDPHRDVEEGHDANNTQKRRIAFDFIHRLRESGLLQTKLTDEDFFAAAMETDAVAKSQLMDITEFGRMAHAEMNAILDAARLGRPTKNATLYCTTFPCHNCAKHIVAAGIARVVFVQPYPKSQALDLHGDAISLGQVVDGKVTFEHFIGISPRRYRDIFEKGKRRGPDGTIESWYEGEPMPRVEDRTPTYAYNESPAIFDVLELVATELGLKP